MAEFVWFANEVAQIIVDWEEHISGKPKSAVVKEFIAQWAMKYAERSASTSANGAGRVEGLREPANLPEAP